MLEAPGLGDELTGTGSAAPTAAPSPLVKSIHAESKAFAYSRAATPLATRR